MSINELQDEVITEFSDFDDWMDRYQLLIDLGKMCIRDSHNGEPQQKCHHPNDR